MVRLFYEDLTDTEIQYSKKSVINNIFYFVVLSSFILHPSSFSYAFCFDEAGQKYGISPVLLECIAKTESNLDPKATNKNKNGSVDIGLMQVNSFWIKSLGFDGDRLLNDCCYNTMAGAQILRQCIDRHGYTWEAVGCYNAVSPDKKKAYSWKIFRQLKQADKPAIRQTPSSLSFRAWDRGEMP
ncbi:MAG: lytic transglycosylase domain-containing protein [Nitrospirae bacterium]|nr:lytic transglycosylase domain-containing protein [Nitrospirota bacterium]